MTSADDVRMQPLAAGGGALIWYDPNTGCVCVRGEAMAVTVHADGQQPPYYRTADVQVPAAVFTAAARSLGTIRPAGTDSQ